MLFGYRPRRCIGGYALALLFALRCAPHRHNRVYCRISDLAGCRIDRQLPARAPRHSRRSHGGLALRINYVTTNHENKLEKEVCWSTAKWTKAELFWRDWSPSTNMTWT